MLFLGDVFVLQFCPAAQPLNPVVATDCNLLKESRGALVGCQQIPPPSATAHPTEGSL